MSLENFCDFKVYALETEQSYAGELAKNWEDEERARRAKREATLKRISQIGILKSENDPNIDHEHSASATRRAAIQILQS
jgi:hypothetical protein